MEPENETTDPQEETPAGPESPPAETPKEDTDDFSSFEFEGADDKHPADEDWMQGEDPFQDDEAEFDRRMAEIEAEKKGEVKPEPAEGEPKAEGETPPEPEAPVKSPWTSTVGAVFGEAFESDDAVIEKLRAVKDENEGFNGLKALLAGNERLGAFFQAMLEEELDPEDAALKAFRNLSRNTPDPYDDPDEYAEYMKRRGREEAEERHQREQAEKENAKYQRAQTDIDRAFASFTAEHNMTEAEAKAFRARFAAYRLGDPDTGRIPPDVFERERKADRYDADVKKAKEDGIAQGRNEAIKELTARRGMRGDSIPALAGARQTTTDLSAEARKAEERRRIFAEDGEFDATWPPRR